MFDNKKLKRTKFLIDWAVSRHHTPRLTLSNRSWRFWFFFRNMKIYFCRKKKSNLIYTVSPWFWDSVFQYVSWGSDFFLDFEYSYCILPVALLFLNATRNHDTIKLLSDLLKITSDIIQEKSMLPVVYKDHVRDLKES